MSTVETRTELAALLERLGACNDAAQWASGYSALSAAWAACERADWMLWLAGKMAGKDGWPTRKQVVLVACVCAERALRVVPAGEERPLVAIETAQRWVVDEATIEEVRSAASNAAAYAANAASYASYASYAATNAATAAYAYAAANAATAASYASYASSYAANAATELKAMADIVRTMLTVPEVI